MRNRENERRFEGEPLSSRSKMWHNAANLYKGSSSYRLNLQDVWNAPISFPLSVAASGVAQVAIGSAIIVGTPFIAMGVLFSPASNDNPFAFLLALPAGIFAGAAIAATGVFSIAAAPVIMVGTSLDAAFYKLKGRSLSDIEVFSGSLRAPRVVFGEEANNEQEREGFVGGIISALSNQISSITNRNQRPNNRIVPLNVDIQDAIPMQQEAEQRIVNNQGVQQEGFISRMLNSFQRRAPQEEQVIDLEVTNNLPAAQAELAQDNVIQNAPVRVVPTPSPNRTMLERIGVRPRSNAIVPVATPIQDSGRDTRNIPR
jgi:hypothetical protein